jgi:hypothetical protein
MRQRATQRAAKVLADMSPPQRLRPMLRGNRDGR